MGGFNTSVPMPNGVALDLKPVEQQDPLQALMQYRQQRSMIAQRQAETADLQAQAQQRSRDLADENTYQQLTKDPAIAKAFHQGDFSAAEGKVQPKTLDLWRTNQANLEKQLQANTQEKNKIIGQAYSDIADATQGLQSLIGKNPDGSVDLSKVNAELPNTLARLTQAGVFKNAGIEPPQNETITDPSQLDALIGGARGAAALHEKVAGLQKTQSEASKNAAQAGEATARGKEAEANAAKTTLEQQLTQHKLDLYNVLTKTPQALETLVSQSIDPQEYPHLYKRAVNEAKNAPDLEGINNAIGKYAQQASEQERQIATESSPQVLAARRDSAIAQAKALREGDNPALAGVPPAAAPFATAQATKLDTDYLKAREATEAMGKLLDLAGNGNVAAGANLSLAGVGAVNAINGIRRINSAEIQQYGTAGSLLQKIQGKLQGWVEGQPIPGSVLNDIRELHQQLGEQSYRQYTSGLDSLNQRTGAKFGPTQAAPNIRKGGNTPNKDPLGVR